VVLDEVVVHIDGAWGMWPIDNGEIGTLPYTRSFGEGVVLTPVGNVVTGLGLLRLLVLVVQSDTATDILGALFIGTLLSDNLGDTDKHTDLLTRYEEGGTILFLEDSVNN